MSARTATTWTCDRCAATTEEAERGQPVGWAAIYEVTPPLMAVSESQKAPVQICKDCRTGLGAWFTDGRKS